MAVGQARVQPCRALIGAVCLALAVAVPAGAQSPQTPSRVPEADLKATFLVRLGSYVSWNASRTSPPATTLTICLIGKNPLSASLDFFKGEMIQGRALRVLELDPKDSTKSCDIAYLSRDNPKGARALKGLRALKGVLTVSDREDFTCSGGIVRFVIENERLALEINRAAASDAEIQISSQLLALARLTDVARCRGRES